MRHIEIIHRTDLSAEQVYTRLSDLTNFEKLCPSVNKVDVNQQDASTSQSAWDVNFHDGKMRWVEQDIFDAEALTIDFTQVEGDADEFSGQWKVASTDTGSQVTFTAQFCLGIPSLADILEPIAEDAIKDNVDEMLNHLLKAA